jgi:hypothetical protein
MPFTCRPPPPARCPLAGAMASSAIWLPWNRLHAALNRIRYALIRCKQCGGMTPALRRSANGMGGGSEEHAVQSFLFLPVKPRKRPATACSPRTNTSWPLPFPTRNRMITGSTIHVC